MQLSIFLFWMSSNEDQKVEHDESVVYLIRVLVSHQALFRANFGHRTLLHCQPSEAVGIFNHSETNRKRHFRSGRYVIKL